MFRLKFILGSAIIAACLGFGLVILEEFRRLGFFFHELMGSRPQGWIRGQGYLVRSLLQ